MIYRSRTLVCAIGLVTVFPACIALAQTRPEAGDLLRQEAAQPEFPLLRPTISVEGTPLESLEAGGGTVLIEELLLSGTNALTDDELYAVIGDYRGVEFDLAGLQELANRISRHYQSRGYPFARAYLPQQDIFRGVIRIDVLEGRYGEVSIRGLGDGLKARGAERFLGPIASGRVIESSRLERTALLIDEQPGYRAVPVIRPGERLGTGDVEVRISPGARLSGRIAADNFGNTYSGQRRARLDVSSRRNVFFGDQLALGALYTEESTQFVDLSYGLPLGGDGLRATAGYSSSDYQLGDIYSGFSGESRTRFAELSYPVVRSQQANLTLRQRIETSDLTDLTPDGISIDKDSRVAPLGAEFDWRDGLGGGGVSFGRVGIALGSVGGARGTADPDFTKIEANLARLQSLPAGLSAYFRFAAQVTGDNLDGSQRLTLGGANAVRAFPQGEASGDTGYSIQLELRYRHAASGLDPYVFYDFGETTLYGGAVPEGQSNARRSIGGGGVGLRFAYGRLSLDAVSAWRTRGGAPQSTDSPDRRQAWVKAEVDF